MCTIDVHHAVEEVAVVRDDEQRAGVALEPVLQPDDGVEVEVVGRLVEQQQVGRAHQRLREVQAHAPAAGEARHRLLHLLVREAQAEQQLLGARAHGVGVGVAQRRVQLAHAGCRRRLLRPRRALLRAPRRSTSPSIAYSTAGRSSAGVSCATCATRQCAGKSTSPLSACSSPRSSANRLDLPEPLAPIRPTCSPGLSATSAPSSSDLGAAAEGDVGEADHAEKAAILLTIARMLIDFFLKLKSHKLPVSIKEYLTLLEAMDKDVIGPSIDEFYYLSRTALVKDEANFDKFDRAFAEFWQGVETIPGIEAQIPLEWLLKQVELHAHRGGEEADRGARRLGKADGDAASQRLEEQKGRHQGGNKWIGTGGTSPVRRLRLQPRRRAHRPGQVAQPQRGQGLGPARVPQPRRFGRAGHAQHQGRACGACASSRAQGAPDEFDLENTISQHGEEGLPRHPHAPRAAQRHQGADADGHRRHHGRPHQARRGAVLARRRPSSSTSSSSTSTTACTTSCGRTTAAATPSAPAPGTCCTSTATTTR